MSLAVLGLADVLDMSELLREDLGTPEQAGA
jgi:hypothetical protein